MTEVDYSMSTESAPRPADALLLRQPRLARHHGAVRFQGDGGGADIRAALKEGAGALLAGARQLVLHVNIGFAAPGHFGHLLRHHEIEHFAQDIDRQAQARRQRRQVRLACLLYTSDAADE